MTKRVSINCFFLTSINCKRDVKVCEKDDVLLMVFYRQTAIKGIFYKVF